MLTMERESLLNYNLILPINVSWYFIPNAHSSQRAKATRLLTGNVNENKDEASASLLASNTSLAMMRAPCG